MARLLTSSIVFIALYCAGCAATESKVNVSRESSSTTTTAAAAVTAVPRPQPEWVAGESKEYPRLDYITSRTQATSAEAAAQLAQGKISRTFMVELSLYDMSERQAQASGSYELNRTFQPESAMTSAAPEVERILGKIRIVDQWYDSSSNTHHALAALPRNTGLGYLRSQIEMLDTNTSDFLKNASDSSDPLTKMGMTALAWRAQQLRASLQESMRDVDLTRRGIEPKWELAKLSNEINTLLVNLKIYPSGAAGDANAEEIGSALNSALKIADLKPAARNNADYTLSATVTSAIIGEENGWAVGQGTINLTISDKENRERNSKQWTLKVPGISEEAALRRVLEKSEFTLKKEMRNSLIDMALGN